MRRAFVMLIGAAALLASVDAAAFCRSTTCRGDDCPLDDQGCPATGLPLFWTTSCVGFSFQRDLSDKLDPDATRDAIRRAFFAWTSVPCPGGSGAASITFAELADTSCGDVRYDDGLANVNVIAFRDDAWSYHGIDNTLAQTTVTFSASTGEILDADIAVNTATNHVTTGDADVAYDLQSLMTHEIGHFIGLAHSPDANATMFATYDPGTTAIRRLSDDDVAAICAAYPPARGVTCDPTPRGGLATSCPAAPEKASGCATTPGTAGWLVVVAALFASRRRRS